MTNRELASYACAVAAKSASWAHDCMILPEQINLPALGDAPSRFAAMLRRFADQIDKHDDK